MKGRTGRKGRKGRKGGKEGYEKREETNSASHSDGYKQDGQPQSHSLIRQDLSSASPEDFALFTRMQQLPIMPVFYTLEQDPATGDLTLAQLQDFNISTIFNLSLPVAAPPSYNNGYLSHAFILVSQDRRTFDGFVPKQGWGNESK